MFSSYIRWEEQCCVSSEALLCVRVATDATRWIERTRSTKRRGHAAARSTHTTRGASRGIDTEMKLRGSRTSIRAMVLREERA